MLDDGGRLAAGGLEDPRQVLIQDGLGVFVGGARQEGQRMRGELRSANRDL